MRFNQAEKYEIIRLVEDSEIGPIRTIKELGINKSTFYNWYGKYKQGGYDALGGDNKKRYSFRNKIPDEVRSQVIDLALDLPALSPRELAYHMIDKWKYYISESSVYRILKSQGLITSPAYIVMQASDEFKDKTTRVNEVWQTDFTYFKIIGWRWYYLSTVLDDYSRYILNWELCSTMKAADVTRSIDKALTKAELTSNQMPRLLSDNGSCYISDELADYIEDKQMSHVRGKPNHPQTQGKIERYHRSMKNVVKLENYYSPEELIYRLNEFVEYYNNHRYHESLKNTTPADVYCGRALNILEKRKQIKTKTMKQRRKKHLSQVLII
jgi:transposase InsO family protein